MTPESRLERNLAALARRDRALVERLCWPVDAAHVSASDDGRLRLLVHQMWVPLELTSDEMDRALAPAAQVSATTLSFVFGAGAGEMTTQLLASHAQAQVTLWDRDPLMLRTCLARADWSDDLATGRLRLALGCDLWGLLPQLGSAAVVFHPLLAQVYRNERALLAMAPDHLGKRALICAGGLFVDDLADALRESGHAVFTLDAQNLAVEELTLTLQVVRPVLVAAINYTEGLAEFCQAQGVPLLCWEVDPTLQRLRSVSPVPTGTRIFTYRRAHVADYLQAGFPSARFLPLATNPARRAPVTLTGDEAARFAVPVAFVGASMADRIDGLRGDFARAFTAFQVESTGLDPGPAAAAFLLDQLLAEQHRDLGRYLIPALLDRAAPGFRDHGKRPGAFDVEQIAGELAAGERRLALISGLAAAGPAPDRAVEVHVWGDSGWQAALGARYRGVAGHFAELNKIYGSARINLDIGRLYQMDIVTMRVFDVLACRGFLLTERSAALTELFIPGHDLDVFTGGDELKDKIRYYLARPELAARIAAQGRATVLEKHTVAQRLAQMLAALPAPL